VETYGISKIMLMDRNMDYVRFIITKEIYILKETLLTERNIVYVNNIIPMEN
jgi:hypothetical protein